jgi:hypothetical protein
MLIVVQDAGPQLWDLAAYVAAIGVLILGIKDSAMKVRSARHRAGPRRAGTVRH